VKVECEGHPFVKFSCPKPNVSPKEITGGLIERLTKTPTPSEPGKSQGRRRFYYRKALGEFILVSILYRKNFKFIISDAINVPLSLIHSLFDKSTYCEG
jgi:hypothetical protein